MTPPKSNPQPAGRKPKYAGVVMKGYNVRLTPAQAENARAWGNGELSTGVRWLLDALPCPQESRMVNK